MSKRPSPQRAPSATPASSELRELLAREAIVARLTELFLATDRKDWSAVEDCFMPEVRFDMSSAGGGPEAVVPASDIALGWRTGLAPIEQVHHQAGNHVVRLFGDRAEANCYGIAYHYKKRSDGKNVRVFVGSYDFTLAREGEREGAAPNPWRITAMRFNLKFLDGNATLEASE